MAKQARAALRVSLAFSLLLLIVTTKPVEACQFCWFEIVCWTECELVEVCQDASQFPQRGYPHCTTWYGFCQDWGDPCLWTGLPEAIGDGIAAKNFEPDLGAS